MDNTATCFLEHCGIFKISEISQNESGVIVFTSQELNEVYDEVDGGQAVEQVQAFANMGHIGTADAFSNMRQIGAAEAFSSIRQLGGFSNMEPIEALEGFSHMEEVQSAEGFFTMDEAVASETLSTTEEVQALESFSTMEPVQAYPTMEQVDDTEVFSTMEPTEDVGSFSTMESIEAARAFSAIEEPCEPVETFSIVGEINDAETLSMMMGQVGETTVDMSMMNHFVSNNQWHYFANENVSEGKQEPEVDVETYDWSCSDESSQSLPKKRYNRNSRSGPNRQRTSSVGSHDNKAVAVRKRRVESGSSDGSTSTSSSFTAARQRPRVRSKIDSTSFRCLMGPNLRTLSALLDITGMKNVHDLVPYDIIRRFHPTDMYRTIIRSIQPVGSDGSTSSNANDYQEPDWEHFVSVYGGGVVEATEVEQTSVSESRMFYKSPFGRPKSNQLLSSGKTDENFSIVSIKKEKEINGKFAESPEVKSAVGSAELNATLNLYHLAEKCSNVELKSSAESSNGPLLMRIRNPQCVALVYERGKLIVVGAKSYDQFRIAARKFARMIQKTGVQVKLTQLKMHFHVGLAVLPFEINFEALMRHEYLSKFVLSDPNIFPGVIIKFKNNPILCLVFGTGAVLFTEAVEISDMKNALDLIYPSLRLFGYHLP